MHAHRHLTKILKDATDVPLYLQVDDGEQWESHKVVQQHNNGEQQLKVLHGQVKGQECRLDGTEREREKKRSMPDG